MTACMTWNLKRFMAKAMSLKGSEIIISKFPRNHFFKQIPIQAESLYNVVKNFAALTGNEIVYDLYCGTGSIGIFLSGGAKKIIGVDAIEDAIKDAIENAALNNLHHTSFFCGDVIEVCNDAFFNLHGRPGVIIVDRPVRAFMLSLLINSSPSPLQKLCM